MNELDAGDWIALVPQDCDEPEAAECLLRHGVSLTALEWVLGVARVPLPEAGVILQLWKPATGSEASVFVQGVEFVLCGMRNGRAYEGSLPHGIEAADTLMDITPKLHPAMPTPGKLPHAFDAVFPEHRLVIQMDDDDMLQSVCCLTTRELPPG